MAAGCGKVVVGRARALYAMSLHSISARMASRGAVHRAQSAQMCRIAASTVLGGITGTIKRLSSARHFSAAAFSWCCLSSGNARLGNAKSANTVTHAVANANSAAHAANKEQRPSLASAIATKAAPHSAAFQQHTHWQESSLPTLQCALPTLGDVVPRPTSTPQMPQHILSTLCNVAPWPTPTPLMPQRIQPTFCNDAPWPTLTLPMPQLI
jgi:hypothetical protein